MRVERRAFTLVEIVVVIAIIAILATVILISYSNVVENSKKSKAKGEIQAFLAGIKMMRLDTGEYPGHMNGLCKEPNADANNLEYNVNSPHVGLLKNETESGADAPLTGLSPFKNWNGPYMDAITNDPWGSPYKFDPDYYCGSFGTGETWEIGELEEACVPKPTTRKYVRVIVSIHLSNGYGGGNVAALVCTPPAP